MLATVSSGRLSMPQQRVPTCVSVKYSSSSKILASICIFFCMQCFQKMTSTDYYNLPQGSVDKSDRFFQNIVKVMMISGCDFDIFVLSTLNRIIIIVIQTSLL